MSDGSTPRVTVVLPTHERASFLPRALGALAAQAFTDWELRAVDDGSADGTAAILAAAAARDPRVHVHRHERNRGVGAALNTGLAAARGDLVAYLPDDDTWYPGHLASLVAALEAAPDAALAYAGVRHHYNRETTEPLPDDGLQLVQLLHRRVPGWRWRERDELVTDSLAWMGLDDLGEHGPFVPTGLVTCEWVHHAGQGHKLLREPVGGIAPYRRRYRVAAPLRFHSTAGDEVDEVARYARYRDPARPTPLAREDGLRILLVGELAYNADRVLALEEAGHRLFGLWMPDPYWYNTVGPLPFGHVVDATSDDPAEAIRETRPDVIYALLNWQAVPFAASVLRANPGVPFVWHFKEGPFISLEKGHWADLVELTAGADGLIHTSEEMRAWFGTVVPGADDPERTLVLDGDLPKADWFEHPLPARGPFPDDGIHTVVPGRPIGLHPHDVAALAARDVHLHFYGDFTQGQWREWIERTRTLAPAHLHLHGTVGQERWVTELGRYDAGWLHVFGSRNEGDVRRATWDDLNLPARMATLAAAGLPMLQRANEGHVVATRAWGARTGADIAFEDWDELAARLHDDRVRRRARDAVLAVRHELTFDAHVPRLEAFLRHIVNHRAAVRRRDMPTSSSLMHL
ncbi:MAG TPA: glycosyltransferase family 2 protein [Candidatus Limnocylindrales bacterium]|nr:glycosyltransferase family 2 protein [Candidatus Limnocylindrales bacterium]